MVQRVVAGDEDDQRLLLRPPGPAGLLPERRPACPGSRPAPPRPARRCRCRAPGRSSSPRPAGPRPRGPAPAPAAPRAGSRPGRSPPAGPGRRDRGRAAAAGLVATDSALRRDRTNASVRAPRSTRSASRSAASAAAERRSGAPCSPVRSVSGGSQRANVAPGRGRAVVGDRLDRGADQPARGGGRIGDRRRGQHEHRIGAVAAADPPQPPQHVPDVRAEDPAVGVALVDDDVGHPAQGARPLLVRRQDPAVEHVGVGHDPARVPADPVPLLAGGVAVVGGRAHRRIGERGHRRQLVAGQRLGRRQVEHAGAGVLGEPGQGGQLVGQRLPRRRPGRDHDVPAVAGQLRGLHLVAPRREHPAASSRSRSGAHPLRPRQRAALPHRHVVHVGDRPLLLVGPGEHRGQEVGARRHARTGAGGRCPRPAGPGGEPAGRGGASSPRPLSHPARPACGENPHDVIRATERRGRLHGL